SLSKCGARALKLSAEPGASGCFSNHSERTNSELVVPADGAGAAILRMETSVRPQFLLALFNGGGEANFNYNRNSKISRRWRVSGTRVLLAKWLFRLSRHVTWRSSASSARIQAERQDKTA